MEFNSRSVKKFQKNTANVAIKKKFHKSFIKNFGFVLELSKGLADVTNLKTITYSGPDFFSCGLREALYLFIRLFMII